MTKLVDVGSVASSFESLDDPRHTRNRKHLLVDIVVTTVCAIICGCDGPTAIHRWAKHRQSWLALHLALPNGIPSRDCMRRLLIVGKRFANYPCDVRVHLITGSSRQRARAALDDARGRRWIAGRREFDAH